MTTLLIKDGAGNDKRVDVDGTGTTEDPYRLKGTNAAAVLTALQAIQAATEALDDTILPTGAATDTLQTAGNSTLTSLDTKLGEVQASPTANTVLDRLKAIAAALAGTLTVATHAVTQSGTWNVTNVSGTVSLPTGAATQTTLASVDTKIGEVQASPTANTVLDRLKAIATALAGTLTVTVGTFTAGETHLGEVSTNDIVIEVTPTMDTSAYAAGDVLFNETDVANVARSSGKTVTLISLCVVDKDDQKQPFDLHFFDRTVTFGTKNGVPSISDADAAFYMGHVSVAAADYKDLGGVSVASPRIDPKVIKPNATSLFIAAVTSGTPTHTASGLVLKLGLTRS